MEQGPGPLTDQDIARYLLENGIPRQYHKRALASYGEVGAMLGEVLKQPERWRQYFAEKQVLNLYGSGSVQEELLISVIRGFLLLSRQAAILTPRRVFEASGEDLLPYYEKDVIGMSCFYNPDFKDCPFTDGQKFLVEEFTISYLTGGGIMVLASNAPMREHFWYSKALRSHFGRCGRDLEIVSRD